MSGKIIIDLPFATESGNEIDRWLRRQPYLYTKHKHELAEWVMVKAPKRSKPFERARVRFVRYSSGTLDDDNLARGCKPLRDALVRQGLIRNDDPAHLEAIYEQVKCHRGEEMMHLEVEDLGGGGT